MCGLVGVFGHIGKKEKLAFSILHSIDVTRGRDSSGLLVVKKDNTYDVLKEEGVPIEMIDSDVEEKYFDEKGLVKGDVKILMGHNRKTTSGKTNVDNAHPFEFNNLVGAHNGTLKIYSLNVFENHRFEVDSQRLYDAMDRSMSGELEGFKDVPSVLSRVDGAMALTWWEKGEHDLLNFFRNSQRTLFWCLSEDKKTFMWASEEWMLKTALVTAGLVGYSKINPFLVDHWQTLTINSKGEVCLLNKSIEIKHRPFQTTTRTNSNNVPKAEGTDNKGGAFVLEGVRYSRVEFFENFDLTCTCCNNKLKWEERDTFCISSDRFVICENCYTADDNAMEVLSEWFPDLTFGYSPETLLGTKVN